MLRQDFALFGLVYGRPKTRKTTWVTGACANNYRVTILDLENNLFPATRNAGAENLFSVPLYWKGTERYSPALAFLQLLRNANQYPFTWDIDKQMMQTGAIDPSREYLRVDLRKSTKQDVLVLDSWSVLCDQIVASKDKTPYNLDAEKLEITQPTWNTYTRDATDAVSILKAVSITTNVVVIGHEYMENTLMYPISVTKAHGQKLAANFNHVVHLHDGLYDTMVNGGLLKPDKKELDKYSMGMLLSDIGYSAPSEFTPSEAFKFLTGAELQAMLADSNKLTASTIIKVKA